MKKLMLLIATFMFVMGSATVAFAQEPVKKAATEQTEENAEAEEVAAKEEEQEESASAEELQTQGMEAVEVETPTEMEAPAETAE